jgi:hypothetical protein
MRAHAVSDPAEILLVAGEAREVERDEHVPLVDARDELEQRGPVVT